MRHALTDPRRILLVLLCVALAVLVAPAPGGARDWTPGPPRFGVGEQRDVPVAMDDGTVLRVDVFFPATDGGAAPGPFPVILTQTPYGKTGGSQSSSYGSGLGVNRYLVERGYIHVVADVRGTGGSEGSFGLFDPVQATDGVTLVHWAADLPHANGRVGLLGPSYLGINQFFTAAAIGPDSPLKAIFPIVAGNDLYRDTAFGGGIPNVEFGPGYMAATAGMNLVNPLAERNRDPAALPGLALAHLQGVASWQAATLLDVLSGGDQAYDEEYWMARNPSAVLDRVVANGIPAYLVGGWHDLFQRGAPLNYSGLQNAFAGRPVGAPMVADQPVTGRYQLLMGPWYHINFGEGVDLTRIELQWFDTWLKDAPTGMADTATPLHLFDLGSGRWRDTSHYPLVEATPATFYLGAGGALSSAAPTPGQDPIVFTGVSNPCSLSTEQWGMGVLETVMHSPCARGEAGGAVGPGALTYDTEPLAEAASIAGPIDVTLFATSTRPDAQWVATIEDVAPDGRATPLTAGALLGSFRQLDPTLTWTAPDGKPLLPHHPYTRASASPVVPGEVTRFDIEVFPTLARIAAGHRLRLTLTTSDTPHLLPTPGQMANLVGGVYSVRYGGEAASFLHLPLLAAGEG